MSNTITKADALNPYLAREKTRIGSHRLFRKDGRLFATNGIMIAWTDDDPTVETSDATFDPTRFLVAESNWPTLCDLPENPNQRTSSCWDCQGEGITPKSRECDECDGRGSCHHCGHDCEECDGEGTVLARGGGLPCPACGGKKTIITINPFDVLGLGMGGQVYSILRDVGAKVGVTRIDQQSLFAFEDKNGCRGVAMPFVKHGG